MHATDGTSRTAQVSADLNPTLFLFFILRITAISARHSNYLSVEKKKKPQFPAVPQAYSQVRAGSGTVKVW